MNQSPETAPAPVSEPVGAVDAETATPSAPVAASITAPADAASAPVSEPAPGADLPALAPEPLLAPESLQEIDAWWGSYSGWTMMPSMVICVGLTVLIAWGSWRLVDKGWVRFSVLTLTAALWLVQALRWSYRVFGYNYRLTSHRLLRSKGLLYAPEPELDLAEITQVSVQHGPHDRVVGVGSVCLILDDPARSRVVLDGVAQPRQVADYIRRLSEQARERRVRALKV
jgi:membrane protein YdbS with pleckstrin-like domain